MKQILPKISVITPSFNQGHFIEETIKSVLNQNYPNLEFMVMDGGSTDNTVQILKKYKSKLSYVSKKDKGQTDAINQGIKKSSGEILMYLNSDDVMLPNTLNVVAEYFEKHKKTMWLTGNYFIINEKGNKIQSFVAQYKSFLRKFPYFEVLAVANFIIQPSTFFKRKLIKEIGYFDQSLDLCMDYDFWLRVIKKYPLHVLPNHFSLFRVYSLSKGGGQYARQFTQEHRVLRRYTDNLLLRFLHKIHAVLIVLAYRIIK